MGGAGAHPGVEMDRDEVGGFVPNRTPPRRSGSHVSWPAAGAQRAQRKGPPQAKKGVWGLPSIPYSLAYHDLVFKVPGYKFTSPRAVYSVHYGPSGLFIPWVRYAVHLVRLQTDSHLFLSGGSNMRVFK